MGRVFSLPTVLRQVPKTLLGRFFAKMKIPFEGMDWETHRERDIEPLLGVLNALPNAEMVPVESELHAIHDLSCETGINALIETAAAFGDHDLAERLPEGLSAYGKAMWVWLEHPEYFANAGLVAQVEQLAWWRKRNDLPCQQPDTSASTLEQLKKEISHLLLTTQGRGRLCSVEVLTRGTTVYFFVYPDDFVQSVQEHDAEGQLAPRTIRRTFSIVFAYDSEAGTLELFAKMSAKLKTKLEELFARCVLDHELTAWQPPAAFTLNHLRHHSTALPVEPQDGISVMVGRLVLGVVGSKQRLTLDADPKHGPQDVYDMIENFLNMKNLRLQTVQVQSVTLVFEFHTLGDRKPGKARITVSYPSGCNLRNQRPERVELIQKYLVQWGIDVRPNDTRSVARTQSGTSAVA
jgi:hypothetical protein